MIDLVDRFLNPSNPFHRQYEALRARFVEGCSVEEAATHFGYAPGSFRNLCTAFLKQPDREFFLCPLPLPAPGPRRPPLAPARPRPRPAPQPQPLHPRHLRRLAKRGPLRHPAVWKILSADGFPRLPRQRRPPRRLHLPLPARPQAAGHPPPLPRHDRSARRRPRPPSATLGSPPCGRSACPAATPSTSISTPPPFAAAILTWRSTPSPNTAAARRASSASSPATPRPASSSSTPTPPSARPGRTKPRSTWPATARPRQLLPVLPAQSRLR